MEVVGDLLGRDRRSRDPALVTPDGRERTAHDLITNAYKAANVLRYLGAREGSTVAVDPAPGLHATLAFLGAAGLGATVRFDPAAGVAAGDRVVVTPVDRERPLDPDPGTNLAAFGGPPERPETTHWEQELWSENPATPPATVSPSDPVLRTDDGTVPHGRLVDAAETTATDRGIDAGTRVVVRTTFADPRAIAAGVVAPLARGGVVVLAGPAEETAASEPRGDLAVVDDPDADPPEPARIDVATLPSLVG
ncbi:hypothetical protein [Halorubrum halodurans]|uniref:Acetyl-CoA synthetase n=1 Tax=Halorubrum halodurans TaxID=1383851 RepID=A0A256ICV2_9EURY|nr:hypothetical protein [Halorubrum halodurans]OYR54385.1 hypothetical protein DJ70_14095 [Halorubrum halodurans]